MRDQTEKLNKWRASTLDKARPQAVERQKRLEKLTARKRQELLFDSGTFLELGQLAEKLAPSSRTVSPGENRAEYGRLLEEYLQPFEDG